MFSPAWSTNGSFDTFYSFLNTTGSIVAEEAIANFTISPAYVQPVKFLPVREAR